MNCLSLNIRGIGEDAKIQRARRLKVAHKINFMGLQETPITDYTNINTDGCWDSNYHDSEGMDSNGRSGGLISIWDTH